MSDTQFMMLLIVFAAIFVPRTQEHYYQPQAVGQNLTTPSNGNFAEYIKEAVNGDVPRLPTVYIDENGNLYGFNNPMGYIDRLHTAQRLVILLDEFPSHLYEFPAEKYHPPLFEMPIKKERNTYLINLPLPDALCDTSGCRVKLAFE